MYLLNLTIQEDLSLLDFILRYVSWSLNGLLVACEADSTELVGLILFLVLVVLSLAVGLAIEDHLVEFVHAFKHVHHVFVLRILG